MNRRQALQVIAAAPIVLSSSVSRAEHTGVIFYGPDEWQAMAAHLWKNYQAYIADKLDWVQPEDDRYLKPICWRFCHSLLDVSRVDGDENSMVRAFFPDQDSSLVQKHVAFGVSDVDSVERHGTVKAAQSRKLRMPYVRFNALKEAIEECPTYHGLDQEFEFVAVCGEELAFDVKREIRAQWQAGERITAYVMRLPPHLGLVSPQFQEGFSVSRGWRLKYSKFYVKATP